MPKYKFHGRKESGEIIIGHLDAANKDEVLKQESKKGLFVSDIAIENGDDKSGLSFEIFNRIKKTDVSFFSRQMASMLRAGLTINKALSILCEQIENKKFNEIIKNIEIDVGQGTSLSDSFAKYPEAFPEIFVNSVRVGEESGHLEEIFDRLTAFIDRESDLNSKIKASLSYPVTLLLISVSVVMFLVVFVFPTFVEMFQKANVELPMPTKIIFNFSVLLREYWFFIISIITFFIIAFRNFITTDYGKYFIDKLKIDMPIFGKLSRKVYITRFCQSMEIMIRSGIPIINALEIVEENIGNAVFKNAIVNVAKAVREGEKINIALKNTGEFPDIVIQAVNIGEETGSLEQSLSNIVANYDKEIDYSIKNLTTLIEPILISFISMIVAFIALSLFLPMADMIKVFK